MFGLIIRCGVFLKHMPMSVQIKLFLFFWLFWTLDLIYVLIYSIQSIVVNIYSLHLLLNKLLCFESICVFMVCVCIDSLIGLASNKSKGISYQPSVCAPKAKQKHTHSLATAAAKCYISSFFVTGVLYGYISSWLVTKSNPYINENIFVSVLKDLYSNLSRITTL